MTSITPHRSARTLYFLGYPSKYQLSNQLSASEIPAAWGQTRFLVSDIVNRHLRDRVFEFAPLDKDDSPTYYGHHYPELYQGKKTTFDFTVACVAQGILQEKLLFEYKSAKSSGGVRVDGNAHERLSFQTLQYLEIAMMHPKTTFNVIASSAFAKYKNKYHGALINISQIRRRLPAVYNAGSNV